MMILRSRPEQFAIFIIDKNSTIRKCAVEFGVSKSTVHNDLCKKLKAINKFLYLKVYEVLNKNFQEKHIRGGNSTKLKYKKIKSMVLCKNKKQPVV